jgi:cyclase
MNRRRFLAASTAAATLALRRGATLAAQAAPAQPPAAPLVTKFEEVRRGVGIFTGNGGTIGYLLNGDGAAVVDSQFLNGGEACVAGLKTRSPKGPQLLFNTHQHPDHTKGNVAFRPLVTKIIAHQTCAEWHKKIAEQEKTTPQEAFADTTFTEAWTGKFGDETLESRYFGAGHTGGDAVVTFQQANVVHMGDLLAVKAHPNIDRPVGASVRSWISVLEKVAARASNDTIFVAGHGKDGVLLAKKADVLAFRNYFTAVLDHVQKGMKAGQSKEEIQKLDAVKGFEDYIVRNPRFSLAFVLGVCYDELGG